MKTQVLNITLSSMPLWLFPLGDESKKVRARSDAEGNVFTGIEQTPKGERYVGEMGLLIPENYIEFDERHVVKVRSGWDGFADEKHYGTLQNKPATPYYAR